MKIQKIKLTFLVFTGLVILSFAVFSYAQNNSDSSKNIFEDSDQDGLSDEEEKMYGTDPRNSDTDGDGYTDSTEIKSGYDPLKPAPGDKLVTNSGEVAGTSTEKTLADEDNLTDKLSQQAVELINKSQSENTEVGIEDLDSIIDETIGKELTFDDLPEIDKETINIKEVDYSNLSEDERKAKEKEDTSTYISAISYIILTNSPYQVTKGDDLEKFSEEFISQIKDFSSTFDNSYFIKLAEKGESSLEQMNDIEVPENLVDLHIKGLQLAKYSISLKDEAKITSEDPAMSIVNLSKVNNLISLTESFAMEVEGKLSDLGISELPINLN